jgi:hypothetical protein
MRAISVGFARQIVDLDFISFAGNAIGPTRHHNAVATK